MKKKTFINNEYRRVCSFLSGNDRLQSSKISAKLREETIKSIESTTLNLEMIRNSSTLSKMIKTFAKAQEISLIIKDNSVIDILNIVSPNSNLHLKIMSEYEESSMDKLSLTSTIRTLDLRSKWRSGVQYLKPMANNLIKLSLELCGIEDDECRHLLCLTILQKLKLKDNKIGEVGCSYLSNLTSLIKLNLYGNKAGDAGCKHLANLTNLRELYIGGNNIGETGCKYLANLTNLQELFLYGSKVGDTGCKYLSSLTSLQKLDLFGNQVGDVGCCYLANLTNIRELYLYGNKIGHKGVKALSVIKGKIYF